MSDIQRQLEAELDRAPAPTFQIVDAVAAGRTALRRRRLALAGSALAVALIAGGGAWLVADGGPASGKESPDVAASSGADGTPTASDVPLPAPGP